MACKKTYGIDHVLNEIRQRSLEAGSADSDSDSSKDDFDKNANFVLDNDDEESSGDSVDEVDSNDGSSSRIDNVPADGEQPGADNESANGEQPGSSTKPKPRSRRGFPNQRALGKILRKIKRLSGQKYERVETKRKKEIRICPAKTVREVDCSKCRKKCSNFISNEKRQMLFQSYYELGSYARQQDYICQRIQAQPTDKRRDYKGVKNVSSSYSFEIDGTIHSVCKRFFLATLNISEKKVRLAMQRKSAAGTFEGDDKRGRHPPANKTSQAAISGIHRHIDTYPALDIRKDSTKRYLPSGLNVALMYRQYLEFCKAKNVPKISSGVYRMVLKRDFNLAFHIPKKDHCKIGTKNSLLSAEEKVEFKNFDR